MAQADGRDDNESIRRPLRAATGRGFSLGCLLGGLAAVLLATFTLGVMVMFGNIGSVRTTKQAEARSPDGPPENAAAPVPAEKLAAPAVKPEPPAWPYQFVATKTEEIGLRNIMDLYAFDGNLDPAELKAFCQDRKQQSKAKAFYLVAIFDDKANAKFPSNRFTAEYGVDPDAGKHVRAVYCYNKLNGYSELRYYAKNSWESVATIIKKI